MLRVALKARMGQLWTRRMAYQRRQAATPACPLCGSDDGPSHLLGGCQHGRMRSEYIKRHNDALRMIVRALRRSRHGGTFTIMDAAARDLDTDGNRVPQFLLPVLEETKRRKMRPDILRVLGLPAHPTRSDTARATSHKSSCTIQIVEVGYCSDFSWKRKFEEKQKQHEALAQALTQAGWKVEMHFIVLGNCGTIYKPTLATLQDLGLSAAQATTLCNELNIHAIFLLHEIVCARRELEAAATRSTRPAPHRRGIG